MAPALLWAQDVTLKVSAKKQVVVGEKFQVAFELNADGKNFKAPSFDGFNVVGGPFTSSSSSFQMINGSMSHSVVNTYTFALQAYKEGVHVSGCECAVLVELFGDRGGIDGMSVGDEGLDSIIDDAIRFRLYKMHFWRRLCILWRTLG